MIAIARADHPDIDFRVDSCSELVTVGDEYFDLIVANYVLMDIPDLPGTMRTFNRVLRRDGIAVLVFSHPCFPQCRATNSDAGAATYEWPFPYFVERKCVAAGFDLLDFEEPRLTEDRQHLAPNPEHLINNKTRPIPSRSSSAGTNSGTEEKFVNVR